MKKHQRFLALIMMLMVAGAYNSFSSRQDQGELPAPLSEETEECLECHRSVTPGIVADWLSGGHAHMTPAQALASPELEREVSSPVIPENLRDVAVGCYECHSLNPASHKDNFEHFEYRINIVVSPPDCAVCHSLEAEQYLPSKKAYAHTNLADNPVYKQLVDTVTGVMSYEKGTIRMQGSSENAKAESCYACHGTRVKVSGTRSVDTDFGEVETPLLTHWPNQGVGRVNPDGSRGACTACHPRHSFSVEIARKPETCSQCHLEPDLPAWNVYRESKHGNIYYSRQADWNWENIPWVIGRDFSAPTCATCHNSLVVDPEGAIVAERSHDFSSRLWVRIFGLIFTHPQPLKGNTAIIRVQDQGLGELPLPTSFRGDLASRYLLDSQAQAERKTRMKRVCAACHATSWADGHFSRLASTITETDAMVLSSTQLMENAWRREIADAANPFDESLEQKWILQWLFYANSIRYASAMSGPDYAAFKNGWWNLNKNLRDMLTHIPKRNPR